MDGAYYSDVLTYGRE